MIGIILIIYGLILAGIGLYSAFKIKTPEDYYIAGKKNGYWQITGSLLASILGGSAILGTANLAVTESWAAAWYLLAAAIGFLALIPVVGKVSLLGKYTLTNLIGRFYGKTAQQSAGVIIPLAWTGIVAAQVIAASKILHSLFQLSYPVGVIFAGAIFIGYTLVGGQISILKTDFFQALVILTGIVVTALFLAHQQEHQHVMQAFRSNFPFNSHFKSLDLLILLLTYSTTFVVGPDVYSRVFCARDARTARKSVLLAAIVLIPFAFVLTYVGVFAQTTIAAEHLKNSVALIDLIHRYLPQWVTGLMAAALLSAVLSSADTTLLTASMMLAELVHPKMDNLKSLTITRYFIVLTGLISIFIALKFTSIVGTLLMALSFYSGAFIIPVLAALTNIRVNLKMSIPAMLTGGLVALSGKIISQYTTLNIGNWMIIAAFIFNFILLKIPAGSKKITNQQVQ